MGLFTLIPVVAWLAAVGFTMGPLERAERNERIQLSVSNVYDSLFFDKENNKDSSEPSLGDETSNKM